MMMTTAARADKGRRISKRKHIALAPVQIEDRELVERAAAGDSDAFSDLVTRHYDRAMRVAFGLVKSQAEAEDVVQDAFVKVYSRLGEFRAASGFYTWLYRIVVNLSIDRLRRRRRERRVDIEDEDFRTTLSHGRSLAPRFEDTDPRLNLQQRQLRQRIREAYEALPEIHQAVILLREVEGLSYTEIAASLGIRKGTVMSRLFHARRSMQESLLDMERDEHGRLSRWFAAPEPECAAAFALN